LQSGLPFTPVLATSISNAGGSRSNRLASGETSGITAGATTRPSASAAIMAAFMPTPDEETRRVKATGSLTGHASPEWLKLKNKGARDPEKMEMFVKELKEAEKTGEWPNFMVMALDEDHTQGLTPGAFTTQSRLAGNDQAPGRIVEAASSSKFRKETAIFVIEDDAQKGPDHVDAHRTAGFVISPWIQRGVVDSTTYTTASMMRTMELILGLPPMTQFDAAATPMYFRFTSEPLLAPAKLPGPKTDPMTKNPAAGPGACGPQFDPAGRCLRRCGVCGFGSSWRDEVLLVATAGFALPAESRGLPSAELLLNPV
jgi:hypothetical protein